MNPARWLLILVVVLLLPSASSAEDESPRADGITARIVQRHQSFASNEPIVVDLEVHNPTAKPLQLLARYPQRMGVRFRCSDREVRSLGGYATIVYNGPAPTDTIKVEPHSTSSYPIVVNRYLRFARTGQYEIDCDVYFVVSDGEQRYCQMLWMSH
jgi:hypothetical protein